MWNAQKQWFCMILFKLRIMINYIYLVPVQLPRKWKLCKRNIVSLTLILFILKSQLGNWFTVFASLEKGQKVHLYVCVIFVSLFFQGILVDLMLECRRLVPVIVALTDRLFGCQKHRWLGERLLQTFDQHLLPNVKLDYTLVACFPIFDKIAESDTIPPRGLLELLTKFMAFLVVKHGPYTGLRSWSQGSRVLGICRTFLMHHHSSRLFLRLSHLFAFTCLYFPDLEVRDNARYD